MMTDDTIMGAAARRVAASVGLACRLGLLAGLFAGLCSSARAQLPTLLPEEAVVGLANTVSGARPLQNLTDLVGYEQDRTADEYAGTYRESALIARKAREYGFSAVEILRYPRGPVWDGISGELWITAPVLRKVIDFRDITTALAPGSVTGVYEGEAVWVEDAADAAAYAGRDVTGKIVLTASSTRGAFQEATARGALGVVNMNAPRPYVAPDAILWSNVGRPDAGFAFNLSAPLADDLRALLRQGPVTLQATIEATWREVDNEVVTAVIPGDGSTDEWVHLSAHVFEGVNKQGAADDGSGAVLILEAGRTLLEAVERGYVRRPARSLRFLWVDEFSGTYAFLDAHPEELARTTADLNIDMAGQNVTLNNNATRLYRMPHSRIHFLGDVSQEFFEWVGRNNIERVHERRGGYRFSFPILDPYGTRDAWRYVIEPFYGSSDHQVYNDRGVPAVLFNHWPDLVYHTSHDRPGMMDATQMKRTAFIAAAAALVVAGAPEVRPVQVAAEAYGRGKTRIADEIRTWGVRLAALSGAELADGYKAFTAALHQWYLREERNVRSVLELTRGSTSADPRADEQVIERLAACLEAEEQVDQGTLRELYRQLAGAAGVQAVQPALTEAERKAVRLVPTATGSTARVRTRDLPGFSAMEVRNFVDGRRSALEIWQAVNSEYALEYGPVTLDGVVGYLRDLAQAGVVSLPAE